jgi:hypothetical protein
MGPPAITKTGWGTIKAIRKVWVDTTSATFAMVMPEEGSSRLAVRIGPNITPEGGDYFLVGDKVKYTVLIDPGGDFPRAQDLMKLQTS